MAIWAGFLAGFFAGFFAALREGFAASFLREAFAASFLPAAFAASFLRAAFLAGFLAAFFAFAGDFLRAVFFAIALLLRPVCTAEAGRGDQVPFAGGTASAWTGGRRSAQGRADSSWAATRSSVASSPNRACSWAPIGRPAAFHISGTLMAGWPLTLANGVNGKKANTRLTAPSMTPGRRSRKPRCSAITMSWANASMPWGTSAPMPTGG